MNNDIRHLSSSAKALYELEIILAVPALLEVTRYNNNMQHAITLCSTGEHEIARQCTA